jgi:GDP-L-fucose synthase
MAAEMPGQTIFDLAGKRVWVAGHAGMVGASLVRHLAGEPCEVLTVGRDEVDLRRQDAVEGWMDDNRPDVVLIAAATVGGLMANDKFPARFLYDNLAIETNIIHGAWRSGVEKLLFMGSSCIYPKLADQPMSEEALLTGALEPTNEWYAIAKIAGIKLCQAYRQEHGCDFISAMPTSLYGPGDNFDSEGGHVIPALMGKAHKARQCNAGSIEIWGSGAPLREFLYVEDAADGLVHLLKNYSAAPHINIGAGREISIADLARLICQVVGFDGALELSPDKPDGVPRKLLDCARMTALGWTPSTDLRDGLARSYAWYLEQGLGAAAA